MHDLCSSRMPHKWQETISLIKIYLPQPEAMILAWILIRVEFFPILTEEWFKNEELCHHIFKNRNNGQTASTAVYF